MAAVRYLEFAKIAIFVKWPISACDASSPFRNLHKSANMAPRDSQKRFSIWRPSAILNLKKIDFFVKFACWEWKFVSVYQIWSKSDNSRLRYGNNAIFKMAVVRRPPSWIFENYSIGNVTYIGMWAFISVPNFALIGQYSAEVWPKTIFNMASVRHLEFDKFQFFVQFLCLECSSASVCQIWSKSLNSQLKYGDKAIFKMAAVRHLEFSKIAVLVMCPVLACDSLFPIQISHKSPNTAPRYSQKNLFQYGVRPPSWIWKISIFCLKCILGMEKCIGWPNLIEIG